uniref:Putative sigma-70 region domain containing protein n=1 Tax=viral metagenome TaxID=1070528 RepID=A0A6M3JCW6_9ZZZZ
MQKSIYDIPVKKIASLLTKDLHLREDLKQEMLLYLFKNNRYYDEEMDNYVLWVAKNRAIDYLRKFYINQIPYGSMEDIETIFNKNNDCY